MAKSRRENIIETLNSTPITATNLANQFNVSRQVIVGDIAILRAAGNDIISTPKGYILEKNSKKYDDYYVITCKHSITQLSTELYTIVDNGGIVIDVIVEHEIYGQIRCPLYLNSRYDCEQFIEKIKVSNSSPLCDLTNGIHMHTISCPSEECFNRITENLKKYSILVD